MPFFDPLPQDPDRPAVTAPPAGPPSARSRRLRRAALAAGVIGGGLLLVAVYGDRLGLRLPWSSVSVHATPTDIAFCPARRLIGCDARVGLRNGREARQHVGILDPPINCDRLSARAHDRCDAVLHVASIAPAGRLSLHAACLALGNVFELDTWLVEEPDTRNLPPGRYVLRCMEGEFTGHVAAQVP